MNSKESRKELKRLLKNISIYTVISIPLALLFLKVIELKYTVIFWSFYAIMGVSAIIAEFYIYEPDDTKSPFGKIIEHIVFVCFITMMFTWAFSIYLKE
jgi:hypothetical protein